MRLLFTFLIFMAVISLNAQHFNAGVSAGIVGSQVDGDRFGGYNKAGISAGLFVNYTLSDHTALQFELNFAQKGSRHNPNYEKNDLEQYLMRIHYMELPVMYRMKLNAKFDFELGLIPAVLISSYEEAYGYELTGNSFRSFNLNGAAGFNYHLTKSIGINLRFAYSLMPLREKATIGDRNILFQWGQFSNAFVFTVNYTFHHAGE
jgi:hypothetical protein